MSELELHILNSRDTVSVLQAELSKLLSFINISKHKARHLQTTSARQILHFHKSSEPFRVNKEANNPVSLTSTHLGLIFSKNTIIPGLSEREDDKSWQRAAQPKARR